MLFIRGKCIHRASYSIIWCRYIILVLSMEYFHEIRELPNIIKEIVGKFHEKTPKRLKLIDYFIIFLTILTGLQLVYYAAIGRHPFEALLAGVYTSMGTMIFTGNIANNPY